MAICSKAITWNAALLLALAAPGLAFAQSERRLLPPARTYPVQVETMDRPSAQVVQASGPIVIDGQLDDAAWQDAEPLSEFIQGAPKTGYPATEQTVVRLLYDSRYFYVAARCEDSEPDKLVVPGLFQDFSTPETDLFGFSLDTFHDRRNAFTIIVNPRGALKESQHFDDSRYEDLAWEGVIFVKTSIESWGWSAEFAIPLTTLRFDPSRSEQVWGANFARRIRRKNEESFWAPLDRRDFVHRVSKAGTLSGIRGVQPGRNLSFKPFALAANSSGSLVPDRGSSFDGGVDLKYGVTPQLTLDLTYRTDFSQVEVDQEQVNLTRFSLFFPEKRDFFIENSGLFSFGDSFERASRAGATLRDFTFFHSRQIGLEREQPVPILAGARLSGTVAKFQLGVLNMQTEKSDLGPAENFSVVRVRRNLRGKADLGLMFVNRQTTSDEAGGLFNRSYGMDATVRPIRNLIVNSYLAATTESPHRSGNNAAARLLIGWRDSFWNVNGFFKQMGPAFNPGVGFVRRRDMRHTYGTVGVHPRVNVRWVQEMNPYVELHYITDLDSVLETREQVIGFNTLFLDGGLLEFGYRDTFDRIPEAFEVGSGASVEAGDYGFREGTVGYSSSNGRAVAGTVALTHGGFYGGRKTSVESTARWRVDYHLTIDASLTRNDITLGGPSFTADVYGLRAKYGFSTSLFASAFLQHNTETSQRVINLRLDYVHSPLSDLFVVYTERRLEGSGLLEKIVTVKLTKLLAF